jgi:ABC-type uncharacterized transport system YnjBCD substrate-binding protein
VIDRAPIYVDRDFSKEATASHAKILAVGDALPVLAEPHGSISLAALLTAFQASEALYRLTPMLKG